MIRQIRQAAVIGSGVMGGGISALLASAGIPTLLLDIVPPDLTDAQQTDPKARNHIVQAGLEAIANSKPALLMQPGDIERIQIGNLEDDFEKLARCDWIVEVVVENLTVKQELLKRVARVRKPGTIVSTNTSGIPLKQISDGLDLEFRQHFLGTHFFNPVRYMKLLEIIPGQETLPEVLEFMASLGESRLGKGIVWAKDTPNFVGNRIGVQGMVRAMQLMSSEGLTIVEVDALLGAAMGRPKTAMFKTTDLVGIDTMMHVAHNTFELVPNDEDRDSFVIPEFVERMVAQGLLGKKTKSGFYKTEMSPEWKLIRKVIDPVSLEYHETEPVQFPCLDAAKDAKTLPERMRAVVSGDDRGSRFAWQALASNLIYAANRIPEISDTIVEIDNAMRWGYNFELGPFETWDAIGVRKSVQRMQAEGLTVPDNVCRMLAAGHESFYRTLDGVGHHYDFASEAYQPCSVSEQKIVLPVLKTTGRVVHGCNSASLIDIGHDVFCCEFHTKMNALNDESVAFVRQAVEWVDEHGAAGLVIGNQAGGSPGAFSAGADLKMMRAAIGDNRLADIAGMVDQFHDMVQSLRYAPFPVVAAPYGLALGGGCEVCLASDRIVAHAELYMGLVEVGVGLLPAGGGCLNLWKRYLDSVPAALGDFDLTPFFTSVFMNIAMAKVSSSAADARANGFLSPADRIVFNRDLLIGEARKEVLRMATEGYAVPVKRAVKVVGEAAQGMVAAQVFNLQTGKFISAYDAFVVQRVGRVIGGGDVRDGSHVAEETILELEKEAFLELCQQEKTQARIDHMLKTGKPLRN